MIRIFLLLFICLIHGIVKGQNQNAICSIDTVEMILAYEYEGQCSLDDMIFKSPELIEYRNETITSDDYKLGVYQFITPLVTNTKKLEKCGIKITVDSVVILK